MYDNQKVCFDLIFSRTFHKKIEIAVISGYDWTYFIWVTVPHELSTYHISEVLGSLLPIEYTFQHEVYICRAENTLIVYLWIY